jgi:hypothetical protein
MREEQRDRLDARRERLKLFETPLLNAQSKHDHERDVRNNAEPKPWFRRKQDTQHPKSAEFERRHR